MNLLYLFPFSYFHATRLRGGSIAFHALFEWLAAALLVTILGALPPFQALGHALLVYIAFISLYEIGYLANDLFGAQRESDGRHRGPQGAGVGWISIWIVVRAVAFVGLTLVLGQQGSAAWWGFFLALATVFALHNLLDDRELKVGTFLWLSWFRFMAPVIFVLDDKYRMGVAFAAAIAYAAFRQLGYLDSKGLLNMPGRQRMRFRLVFFLMPLAGVLAVFPYPEARGFVLLCGYYAIVASLGTLFEGFHKRQLAGRS